jgi:hypothetical protein
MKKNQFKKLAKAKKIAIKIMIIKFDRKKKTIKDEKSKK